MLNRTAKTEREGRTRRAAGIEKYNSNVDRRTSQNGPLIFSAFIAVVVFSCVFVGGFALMGEFNVWMAFGRAGSGLGCHHVRAHRHAVGEGGHLPLRQVRPHGGAWVVFHHSLH